MRIFMNLIVAADENWAIGNKNELLVRTKDIGDISKWTAFNGTDEYCADT